MSTLTGTLVPYTTLFRSVRLEEVAVTAQHLIEVDLLAVRQHRAAADRRGAVDARQLARRRFGERAGRACRHRSEEHTSELQSLMRSSSAVFCLKNKNIITHNNHKYTVLHPYPHHYT